MEKIIFKKEALIASFWDTESVKWINKPIASSNLPISWFLPYRVEIEEGLTIKEILILLEPYVEQIDYIFVNYLKGLQFQTLTTALFEATSEEESIKIDATCLVWASDIKLEDEDYLTDIYPTLMALELGPDEEDSELHPLHDMSASQLLNKELILDDLMELYEISDPETILFDGIVNWKLFDLLSGLLSELAIYAYGTGLVNFSEGSGLVPINSVDLFDHIDSLENFFKEK